MKTILIVVTCLFLSGCATGKMPKRDTLKFSAESKTNLHSVVDTRIDSVVTLRVERTFEF